MSKKNKIWLLKKNVTSGFVDPDDVFELVEQDIPGIAPNQILFKNVVVSIDPYIRLMLPMLPTGQTIRCGTVSVVEAVGSEVEGWAVGDHFMNMSGGWQLYDVLDPSAPTPFGGPPMRIDAEQCPLSWRIGIMGGIGMTAYAAIKASLDVTPEDSVFVTGASGATGGVAVQLVKAIGAKVYGSAGSDAKAAFLRDELGCDGVINYKTQAQSVEDATAAIKEMLGEEGKVNKFLDLTGGHVSHALLLNVLQDFSKICVVGQISHYNHEEAGPGTVPNFFPQITMKRYTIVGMQVFDHMDLMPAMIQEYGTMVEEGKLKVLETAFHGIEKIPEAFCRLFQSTDLNRGKLVVYTEDSD